MKKDNVQTLKEKVLKQVANHWLAYQQGNNDKVVKIDKRIHVYLNKLEELTGLLWTVDLETGRFDTAYFSYWTHPVHYELL